MVAPPSHRVAQTARSADGSQAAALAFVRLLMDAPVAELQVISSIRPPDSLGAGPAYGTGPESSMTKAPQVRLQHRREEESRHQHQQAINPATITIPLRTPKQPYVLASLC